MKTKLHIILDRLREQGDIDGLRRIAEIAFFHAGDSDNYAAYMHKCGFAWPPLTDELIAQWVLRASDGEVVR